MYLSRTCVLVVLISVLMVTPIFAKQDSIKTLSLEQAYLNHWFSYDAAEDNDFSISPLAKDDIGGRAKISFTSDEGQKVNGVIAFPKDEHQPTKLVLALHPMGIDQQFWWSDKSPFVGQDISRFLRDKGHTVLSLDARQHGERSRLGFGPRELIKRAHSDQPRIYIDTIIGSVRDYRIAMNWAKDQFQADEVSVVGYSMGAQMSLLLASYEPSITKIVAMVPPYVASPTSPVAPRIHVGRITNARVLWLAGRADQHSNEEQTIETFNRIGSKDKNLIWFDAGHRLPSESLSAVTQFFESTRPGEE